MAHDRRDGRHQNRTQPHACGISDRLELHETLALAAVREFHNQDAVFRNEADQRDEADLRVDVESRRPTIRPEWHIRRGHFEEGENQRAEHRQRHRAEQNDEGIAEAVELRREHEENQEQGEDQRGQELAPLRTQLARLAGVIDHIAWRHDFRGLVL